MGWGGFLSGVGSSMEDLSNKWITAEMEAIKAQRAEEAAMRKEQRQWERDDVVYDRKREDTLEDRDLELEDYRKKKDIDLEYRQKAGIGSGGGSGKDKMQIMTLEDGRQVFVKQADMERMYKEGQIGMNVAGGEIDNDPNSPTFGQTKQSFLRGALGTSSKGSASQADRYDDAVKLVNTMDERYGEGIPEHLKPAYENALTILGGSTKPSIKPPLETKSDKTALPAGFKAAVLAAGADMKDGDRKTVKFGGTTVTVTKQNGKLGVIGKQ